MPMGNNIRNEEHPMSTIIIKVTLNSQHPAEAALIEILGSIKNRSAHLKMAAFHYWNIRDSLESLREGVDILDRLSAKVSSQ
jgi:hypothetical protein